MEVKAELDNLKNKSSSGIDHINNKIVKAAASVVCDQLTHIVNQSFRCGSFPHALKKPKWYPCSNPDTKMM